jgi:hypothetical protein
VIRSTIAYKTAEGSFHVAFNKSGSGKRIPKGTGCGLKAAYKGKGLAGDAAKSNVNGIAFNKPSTLLKA